MSCGVGALDAELARENVAPPIRGRNQIVWMYATVVVVLHAVALLAARVTGDRDVHHPAPHPAQFPDRRRGSVAQHRAVAAGQDRGHPPAFARQHAVADGVDAAVHTL